MDAKYPLETQYYVVPGDVKFISGRRFGFSNNGFIFKPSYDLVSTKGSVAPATSFSCSVNAFDFYNTTPFTIPTSTTSVNGLTINLNIDSGFNIGATAQYSFARNIVDWESPSIKFPLAD